MTLKRIIPVALLIATAFAVTYALADIDGARIADRGEIIAYPVKTSSDTLETIVLNGSYSEITWIYNLSAMVAPCTLKFEGSHNKLRWVNLDPDGEVVHTLADSGVYGFVYERAKTMKYYRVSITSADAFSLSTTAKIGR